MDPNIPRSEAISPVEETPSSPIVQAPEKGKSKTFVIVVSILLLLIVGVGGYYVYTQYFGPEEKEVVQNEEEEVTKEEIDYSTYTTNNFSVVQISYGQNNEEALSEIRNEIKIPENWEYKIESLEEGNLLKESSKITVTSPEGNLEIVIIPKASTPVYTGPLSLGGESIGEFDVTMEEGIREVSILRSKSNDVNYSYLQKISEEGVESLDIFTVYPQSNLELFTWKATVDILLNGEEFTNYSELLKIADSIVLSLKVIE